MCFWEINVGLIWILGVALENKSVFGQIGQRREWGWGEAVEIFLRRGIEGGYWGWRWEREEELKSDVVCNMVTMFASSAILFIKW
jgi:hypothetical protein